MTSALITDVDDFIAKIKAEFRAPALAEVKSDAVTLEQWVVQPMAIRLSCRMLWQHCYWHVDRYTLGIFSGIIDFQRRGAGQNAGSRCGGCSA